MLLPPGRLPLKGEREIRAFWWPSDGSRTTITAFDWTLAQAAAGRLAFISQEMGDRAKAAAIG